MRIKSFSLGNPGVVVFAVLAGAALFGLDAGPAGAQTLPPPATFQPPQPGTVQVGPPPATDAPTLPQPVAPSPAPGTVQVGPTPPPGTVQIGPAPTPGTVQVGPAGPPPGTVMVPGPQVGPAGPPPGAAICQTEAEPLVKARQARLEAFQAAAKRKAQPAELCGLIKAFLANEDKFRTFLVKNQQTCGVPDEVIANVKKNYAQAATARRRICAAAAAPRPGPATPSFGTPYRTGTGTFDTLGGAPR